MGDMNTTIAPISYVSILGCAGHITNIGPAGNVEAWSDPHAGHGIEGTVYVTLRSACECCDEDVWTDRYDFTSYDQEHGEIQVGRTDVEFPLEFA